MSLYIHRGGQQLGPFEENQVMEQLRDGRLSPNDLGIRHGESEWQPLGKLLYSTGSQPEPQTSVLTSPKKRSKKGLILVLGGLLLVAAIAVSVMGIGIYIRMNPVPTESEVPGLIGKYGLEKLESSEGNLSGSEKGFVATYISNESGGQRRMKYYFHSFNNPVLPMLWDDIKCTGKFERDNRIVSGSTQLGKAAFCNSDTPFYSISFDNIAITLAPATRDVSVAELESMALSLTPYRGASLVPFSEK